MHDLDTRASQIGLDVCFTMCSTEKWEEKWGGYVVYMDETEENEEVCTSDMAGNKLSIILRDGPGFSVL
eukprot:UN04133